ncbi:hypothetical protein K502DRAFT_330200 [Neoconidiobolus thromboides FSU 785]|nr:hypothetical protein K502DRAFT_330200 [Neoconidiobolus thromboides FSU 785]
MLQVFILTILSYFTKLAISEVSNNFYGGECEIIDDTIYYMGGQLNNELFEDIIYLNLNQNFTIYESNWHYLSISNKISMMYPNLISRGSNYNDIYFLSSNQKSNTGANNTNNFYFFNSKNQLFTKDSKSNLKASNDELLFPYLATWNKDPKDDDKFILYGDEDLFIYSNNERGWTNMKSNLYQDKRMDHCSIINQKDNAIYYLGGRYFNNTLIPLNHLLSLNTTSYEFTRVDLKGDLPKPRIGSKLVQLNENELLLLGGIYDTNYTQYSKELYILNLREFKWTKISNLNENNLIGYRPCIVNYYPYIIIAFGYTKNNNNKNLLLLNQNTLTFNSEFVPLSTNSLSMDNTTKGMPFKFFVTISLSNDSSVLHKKKKQS